MIFRFMANRLAPLLNRMVSQNQGAFIRGRCIHDNFILVQQTLRLLHRQGDPRILLKLDISKAFDSVSWALILEVLTRLGFGLTWRNMVCNLLSSATTRVLLNGNPGEVIKHHRGLRQGDPISPMLFIIVMDTLNNLFMKASSTGLLLPL